MDPKGLLAFGPNPQPGDIDEGVLDLTKMMVKNSQKNVTQGVGETPHFFLLLQNFLGQ